MCKNTFLCRYSNDIEIEPYKEIGHLKYALHTQVGFEPQYGGKTGRKRAQAEITSPNKEFTVLVTTSVQLYAWECPCFLNNLLIL